MSTILSLGTSDRSIEEFLMILDYYTIQGIVDVRSFPKSRFEHFIGENLERILIHTGFQYHYLGKELGGYRKGGYEAHMKTPLFKKGLKWIESCGREQRLCLVCAERLPWRCHRRFIGERLSKSCWEVQHIIEKDRVWVPKKGSPKC